MFRYEKLEVWKKAMNWCVEVYHATEKFPERERYGLVAQIRNAATSVPANIAEGSGRMSDADFNRFIKIAYGSLMEAVCRISLSVRLGVLNENVCNELSIKAEEIARMLSGLMKSRSKDKSREARG